MRSDDVEQYLHFFDPFDILQGIVGSPLLRRVTVALWRQTLRNTSVKMPGDFILLFFCIISEVNHM